MSITLRPGTPADAPAIFKVHYSALEKYHAFYAAFFVNHPRDILAQSTALMLEDPGTRVLVAVEDGEVVGFVRWEVHGDVAPKSPVHREEVQKNVAGGAMPDLFCVTEELEELWAEFGRLEEEKERHYDETFLGRDHFYIKHLMVSPNHQNRRIGTALLAAVLEESDRASVPTVLVSSKEALALYRRAGFEELMSWRIDNEGWARRIREVGVEGEKLVEMYRGVEEVETYMVRWPEDEEGR